MNRWALLVVAILAAGCRKHEDGPAADVASLPGACTPMAQQSYSGAVVEGECIAPTYPPCQNRYQTIPVQANVIDHPYDSVNVKLLYPDGTYRTIPAVNIILGRGNVQILNGVEAGFKTYQIAEVICR